MKRISIRFEAWPWQLRPASWASNRSGGSHRWGWRPDGWGRFGGGWNWKLGVQIGGSTAILSLLIGEVIITLVRRCKVCNRFKSHVYMGECVDCRH